MDLRGEEKRILKRFIDTTGARCHTSIQSMFIGRQNERERILHRVQDVIAGRSAPRVLLLVGEAGIGKSSLLEAVRSDCKGLDPPVTVVSTACSTPIAGTDVGEVEALQPWTNLVAQLAAEDHKERVLTRKLVADLAMAWVRCIPLVGNVIESVIDTARIVTQRPEGDEHPVTIDATGQRQIIQQCINLLKAIAGHTPLLLILDDAHWCDDSSVNLLFSTARQLQNDRILIIVAYRRDDALSARGGEGHPITHIQSELERYALCETIELSGLTSRDLDTLLRARYPDYINDDPFETWLSGIAGGNPLFITQYLQTLESDGYIDPRTATINPGYSRARIPPSADAVIHEQIQRLNDETRELLRYASVEGETFTSSVLAATSGMPQLRLLQALRRAQETHRVITDLGRQVVYAQPTTAYRFVHLLLHNYLYNSLGDEERIVLHQAILDFLNQELSIARATPDRVPAIAIRIAAHAIALERFLFAAEVLLEGAQELKRQFAFDECGRMIDQVFSALERAPQIDEMAKIRAEALLVRSRIHEMRVEYALMLSDAESALTLLPPTASSFRNEAEQQRTQALIYLDRLDDAAVAAEQLRTHAVESNNVAALPRAIHLAARVQMKRGVTDAALSSLESCIQAARNVEPDSATEADALCDIGIVLRRQGDMEGAESSYRRSLEIFDRLGRRTSRAVVLNNMGNNAVARGDDEAARRFFADALQISRTVGDLSTAAACLNNLGEVASFERDFHAARSYYQQALEQHRILGETEWVAMNLCNIGHAALDLGDFEDAERSFTQSLKLYEERSDRNNQAYLHASLALLAIRRGDSERARLSLETAWPLQSSPRPLFTNLHLNDVAAEIALWDYHHQPPPERTTALAVAIEHLEQALAIAGDILPRDVERYRKRLAETRALVVRA